MISVPGTIQLHRKGVGMDLVPTYIFVHKSSDDVFTNHTFSKKELKCQNIVVIVVHSTTIFILQEQLSLRNFRRRRTKFLPKIFAF